MWGAGDTRILGLYPKFCELRGLTVEAEDKEHAPGTRNGFLEKGSQTIKTGKNQ